MDIHEQKTPKPKPFRLSRQENLFERFKLFLEETENLTVLEKEKLFKEKFGGSRATFYRYKLNFGENVPIPSARHEYHRVAHSSINSYSCYFCSSETLITVHHIDMNRKHNRQSNLIVLCSVCHAKLHGLLKIKVIGVVKAEISTFEVRRDETNG